MSHFGVSLSRDSYFMDLENDMLRGKWHRPIPTGVSRADYSDWTDLIRKHLDVCAGRNFSEDTARATKMAEYIKWVKAGGGDEWFVEE